MNMSYCRFHNTTLDLEDCLIELEENDDLSELSESEKLCIIKLLTNQLERLNELKDLIECKYQEDLTPEIVRKWINE